MGAARDKKRAACNHDRAGVYRMEILQALNQRCIENVNGFAQQTLRLIGRGNQDIVNQELRGITVLQQTKMDLGLCGICDLSRERGKDISIKKIEGRASGSLEMDRASNC